MTLRHAMTAGALAAAALFAGAGWAQAPDGPREGMGPMHGFERLHKQLNLSPQQEDLWKKAQVAQRDAYQAMRAKGEETRAKLRAEIDKPGVDLKQFAELRDQMREQMRGQMDATRKQVRVATRYGMDRMRHRGARRGAPRGETQGQG